MEPAGDAVSFVPEISSPFASLRRRKRRAVFGARAFMDSCRLQWYGWVSQARMVCVTPEMALE